MYSYIYIYKHIHIYIYIYIYIYMLKWFVLYHLSLVRPYEKCLVICDYDLCFINNIEERSYT